MSAISRSRCMFSRSTCKRALGSGPSHPRTFWAQPGQKAQNFWPQSGQKSHHQTSPPILSARRHCPRQQPTNPIAISAATCVCRISTQRRSLRSTVPHFSDKPPHQPGAANTRSPAGAGTDEGINRVWTIPNIITMGRIGFTPMLAGLIMTGRYEVALVGLFGASISDWFDGYIARKYNQQTVLGGFLDPLADKFMVATLAVSQAYAGLMPMWLMGVMMGRDALLVTGSLAYRAKTKAPGDAFFDTSTLDYKIQPNMISKINTALQFTTLWLALTHGVYGVPGDMLFNGACYLTGGATILSGASYLAYSGLKPANRLRKRLEETEQRVVQSTEKVRDQVVTRAQLSRERMHHRMQRARERSIRKRSEWLERSQRRSAARRHRLAEGRQKLRTTADDLKKRMALARAKRDEDKR